jgi:hypothetical protein
MVTISTLKSIARFRRQEEHGGHAAIDGRRQTENDNSSICSSSARYLAASRTKG